MYFFYEIMFTKKWSIWSWMNGLRLMEPLFRYLVRRFDGSKSYFRGFFYIIDDYLRAFEEVLCISTTKTKSSVNLS